MKTKCKTHNNQNRNHEISTSTEFKNEKDDKSLKIKNQIKKAKIRCVCTVAR